MRYMALDYINGGQWCGHILKGQLQDYEKEKVNFALYTTGQYVEEVSPDMSINSVQDGVVWQTISSIVLWVLWSSRRRRIF